jgi:uncharacterized membrane protein
MTAPSKPVPMEQRPLRILLGSAAATVLLLGAIGLTSPDVDFSRILDRGWRLKAPDLALIAGEPVVLQLHVVSAVTALAIGIVIMLKPKGVGLHRLLGWSWVVAMASTALSSVFLTGLNGDRWSLIHLLTGWVIVALPIGVVAIRRRNVRVHQRMMTGLFIGGLVVAGAFTFIPGRLMWRVFFA